MANKKKYQPLLVFGFLLSGNILYGQTATPSAMDRFNGLAELTAPQLALAIVCLFVLGFGLYSLFSLFNTLIYLQKVRLLQEYAPEVLAKQGIEVLPPAESWWKRMYKKWTNVVPVEREADVMLDHDYDGIHELDNSLPPWWVALFYASIAFGCVYLFVFHFSDWGKSTEEWYAQEMLQAEEDVKAFLATQANAVDENNVFLLTDEAAINRGQLVFAAKCAVCHGSQGEGGIGPNLTDDYWLHPGDIAGIFTTIKYGVPAKGMIAWKAELRPSQMQEVASYIKGLRGTNPPNQKEAQGEIFIEATEAEETPAPTAEETVAPAATN